MARWVHDDSSTRDLLVNLRRTGGRGEKGRRSRKEGEPHPTSLYVVVINIRGNVLPGVGTKTKHKRPDLASEPFLGTPVISATRLTDADRPRCRMRLSASRRANRATDATMRAGSFLFER